MIPFPFSENNTIDLIGLLFFYLQILDISTEKKKKDAWNTAEYGPVDYRIRIAYCLNPLLVWWVIIRNFHWFIFCLRTNLRHFIGLLVCYRIRLRIALTLR